MVDQDQIATGFEKSCDKARAAGKAAKLNYFHVIK